MKISLFFLIASAVLPCTQAFLLFDSIDGVLAFLANLFGFGILVTYACVTAFQAFNLQALLGCKCTGRFGNGIEAELKCNPTENSLCINLFCGRGKFELFLVRGGLFLFPDIKKVKSCVDL
jgi:hypothetical protein